MWHLDSPSAFWYSTCLTHEPYDSVPPNLFRISRARPASPQLPLPVMRPSPAPAQRPPSNGALPFDSSLSGPALSIFAPPPSSEVLPEALQEVLASSSNSRPNGDVMMQDAAEGFESRLRSTRGRDSGVRTGVSASGKGVKVGTAKVGAAPGPPSKKKGKSKADGDIVGRSLVLIRLLY